MCFNIYTFTTAVDHWFVLRVVDPVRPLLIRDRHLNGFLNISINNSPTGSTGLIFCLADSDILEINACR